MSSFFTTQEFTFMKRLRDRLTELNTENNYKKYKECLAKCKEIAATKYDRVGWREDQGDYAWAKFDEALFAPTMISFGGYEQLSPIHDEVMFMTEDHSQMAFKDGQGVVVRYNEFETNKMRDLTMQEFQEVHKIKTNFKGKVVENDIL